MSDRGAVVRGLLGNTRGEILTRIHGSPATVANLAEGLGLTRNAVRGHLATLERDGLVTYTIVRRGVGKPAHLYEATTAARALLSHAHGPVLAAVLEVLTEQLDPEDLRRTMREIGRSLGRSAGGAGTELAERVDVAVNVLRKMGADVRVAEEESTGDLGIHGRCCPLADLVSEYADACLIAESMLETIIGVPVRERCDRDRVPACRFLVAASSV